ncbi:MAG: D-alanyl-D-alanine carboxypeptidase [Hyphomicrobiales bacterium]|nr:MAG: D-alanyl-D-alanine carboxypeptidase [Hyphomicrobiales bacterium]
MPAHLFRRFLAVPLLIVSLILTGPAAATPTLLVDMQSGEVLYDDDGGQPWHPASLTKLMTAYVAFAAVAQGRISLDTKVKISKKAWNQAPSKSGLAIGSSITLKDALYILIVKSANDIAVAIAEGVSGSTDKFVGEMNAMAKAMGLSATHYVNPHGLHAEAQVTSARDLAVLTLYIWRDYPQYLPLFETEAVKLGKANLESNNSLLEHFHGTNGMKTGFVCASGLNIVATVNRGGRQLLGVVLGGSSARERNEMAAELFLRGLAGAVSGTGKSVVDMRNTAGQPVDMRPLICGKKSKEYVAEREAAYPMGLKGQPSYLNDKIVGVTYEATDLGIIVEGVPLPRPRPGYAPMATASLGD